MGNPTGTHRIGAIISADLTVSDADRMRDFYSAVVGWEAEALEMSDERGVYSDYVMKDDAGNWVGGVCHARGVNSGLPPQWIVYVNVADIERSVKTCRALGGNVLKESRLDDGSLQYVLIQDPAGAVLALTKEQ